LFVSNIEVYNEGHFSISSSRCFSYWTNFLNNVSLKVLCKEDLPFWDPKNLNSKESIQKINKWNNL
jgi:hypothetical protein